MPLTAEDWKEEKDLIEIQIKHAEINLELMREDLKFVIKKCNIKKLSSYVS